MLDGIDIVWLAIAILFLWEHITPDKSLAAIKQRWLVNFSLLLISFIITAGLNSIFNTTTIDNSVAPFSLFDRKFDLNAFSLAFVLFLLLDFFSYLLHRIMHHYQLLWRCHCVHHSDLHIDLSTNFRHHPFELMLTWGIMSLFIWLLGISVTVLAAFATISLIIQIWHHSNIKINNSLDKYLGYLLVTPNIHRVHHSTNKIQTNSNYGTIFSIWDRIFSTFTQPSDLTQPINYGLEYFQEPSQQSFFGVLKQPFNYHHNKIKSKFIAQ